MILSLMLRHLKKVELKYKSPLVNSVPWYNDRLYRVDTPTMQSNNPFRGLHLKKKGLGERLSREGVASFQ